MATKIELEKKNNQLENELNDIKKMIADMMKKQQENAVASTIPLRPITVEEDEYIDIPPNKYIKVMSLTNNILALTTELQGQGKPYVFSKFGETKNILYADLANIIHVQETFAKEGKFYIMDKNVVKVHDLEPEYEKLLNKKTLTSILEYENTNIVSIFSNATKSQQNTIVSLLIGKIKNGENVDLNKVDTISKIYGENIAELAKVVEDNNDE